MSQRAVFRGLLLCILSVVAAAPVWAQAQAGGTITCSPATAYLSVGESTTVTAQIDYPVGMPAPSGPQTLSFMYLPFGVTTSPSPVTFFATLGPGGFYTATVSFQLVAAPSAYPASGSMMVYAGQAPATGNLSFVVNGLTVAPSAVTVAPGFQSGDLTATVSYYVGDITPQGPQQLVFSGLPTGANPSPNPVSWVLLQQSWLVVGFRIAVGANTAPGRYTVTVQASPASTGTDTFVLTVTKPGDLDAVVEKATIDLCPGAGPVQNSVVVSAVGQYSGSPTLTFPALPADLKVTPTSIPVGNVPPSQTVTFQVEALAGAVPGPKVVNVMVRDPLGPFDSTTFVVNVGAPGFAPVVAPSQLALTSGGPSGTLTASLGAGPCSQPSRITVTPTGLPLGVTVEPESAELVGPGYVPVPFTFTAGPTAPAGTVPVTFTFKPSTGSSKTVEVPLTVVRTGRIEIAVERAAMDVCPGGSGSPNSLTVTPLEGYSGTPTVTFPNLPAGLTVTPSTIAVPSTPPVRVVTFTVAAAPGTTPGPVTVNVLASDPRGVSAATSFVANLLPPVFNAVVAPSAVTLNAGGASASFAASFVAGDCPPTSAITVTPSGLPPGVTVSPASAVLSPPGFVPVSFTVQATASAAPGLSTIDFNFAPVGGISKVATATVNVCGPPTAPTSATIGPRGNPQGPVTATDHLALAWSAPATGFPPTRYEWRINGGSWTSTAATSASAPPRGVVEPVQLFVRGYACDPERGPGSVGVSPVYSLGPPVAGFTAPSPIVAGRPVTFTDTSSPQATSWLWFPGDGIPATTVQSPTVTFPAAGPKVVVLVATNGSGSSTKSLTVNVLAASASRATTGVGVRALGRERDGRLAIERVDVQPGTMLLMRRIEGDGEAVAFLRLVDADGTVVVERRLVLAAGEEARHDLSAWGATGPFRVELVGPEGLDAAVEEVAVPLGGPELPVAPRQPKRGEVR